MRRLTRMFGAVAALILAMVWHDLAATTDEAWLFVVAVAGMGVTLMIAVQLIVTVARQQRGPVPVMRVAPKLTAEQSARLNAELAAIAKQHRLDGPR